MLKFKNMIVDVFKLNMTLALYGDYRSGLTRHSSTVIHISEPSL